MPCSRSGSDVSGSRRIGTNWYLMSGTVWLGSEWIIPTASIEQPAMNPRRPTTPLHVSATAWKGFISLA